MTTDPSLDATVERVARHLAGAWITESDWGKYPEAFREDYRAYAREVIALAVLPPPADRAAVVADDEGDELVCVDQCGSCDACGMEPFGTPAEGWRQAAHFLRRTARESGDRAGALHGARLIEAELRRLADEPASAGVGVSATPSRAALRESIAETLLDHLSRTADIRPAASGELAFMPEVTDTERLRLADAVLAVLPPPADRAAVLREADWIEEHCPDHGCVEPETDGCHCEIAKRLRRLADEAQQQERSDVGTPEDRCAECGHFQGAHEEAEEPVSVGRCTVCADDDAWHNYEATEEERRLAGARRQPAAAPEPEPPVHGESVAHLAGIPDGRDQWADDEQADTETLRTPAAGRAPTELRVRVLRDILTRLDGSGGDGDSATEQVGASTVRAVLADILADMQPAAGAGQDGAQDRD